MEISKGDLRFVFQNDDYSYRLLKNDEKSTKNLWKDFNSECLLESLNPWRIQWKRFCKNSWFLKQFLERKFWTSEGILEKKIQKQLLEDIPRRISDGFPRRIPSRTSVGIPARISAKILEKFLIEHLVQFLEELLEKSGEILAKFSEKKSLTRFFRDISSVINGGIPTRIPGAISSTILGSYPFRKLL